MQKTQKNSNKKPTKTNKRPPPSPKGGISALMELRMEFHGTLWALYNLQAREKTALFHRRGICRERKEDPFSLTPVWSSILLHCDTQEQQLHWHCLTLTPLRLNFSCWNWTGAVCCHLTNNSGLQPDCCRRKGRQHSQRRFQTADNEFKVLAC